MVVQSELIAEVVIGICVCVLGYFLNREVSKNDEQIKALWNENNDRADETHALDRRLSIAETKIERKQH